MIGSVSAVGEHIIRMNIVSQNIRAINLHLWLITIKDKWISFSCLFVLVRGDGYELRFTEDVRTKRTVRQVDDVGGANEMKPRLVLLHRVQYRLHTCNRYVGPPYYRAASYAAPWWVTVSMPTEKTDGRTDARPDRNITLSARRGQPNK